MLTPDAQPRRATRHLRLARLRPPRPQWPAHPTDAALHAWLIAPGSLTARLMQHGQVSVRRCRQGTCRFNRAEQRALGLRAGHVREVVLMVDGQPCVWARSATGHRGLKGPWKAMRGLGTRPLAELLFSHARVLRSPLERHAWLPHGPEALAARKALGSLQPPRWARASVFTHQGQALRVMESFLPQVADWPTAPHR